MYHPYSGAASYIYANEHPSSPVDVPHDGPYGKMQSFIPIQSVDSLPSTHPYSQKNTWSTSNTTHTETQFSVDDNPRRRRESLRPLLPSRPPLAHPYARPLESWIDDESVAETPVITKFVPRPRAVGRPKRTVHVKAKAAQRRAAIVPYEPRPFEETEREREKNRLASAWRRKIQRRVRRTFRTLRRFLEGL